MTSRIGAVVVILALALVPACDDEPSAPADSAADLAASADQGTEAAPPDLPSADGALPDAPLPDVPAPDLPLPDMTSPDLPLPDMPLPDMPLPDMPLPDMPLPDMPLPDLLVPDMPAPDMPPPTCTDGKHNGSETDVDCGGPDCPGCAASKKCKQAGDCISGVCTGGVCQKSSCTDGVQNGDESDVDCGGKTCPKCAAPKKCQQASDCVGGVCSGDVCQKASCTDGVQNQDESDVDCGGKTCPGCAAPKKCKDGGDCVSGVCKAGVCQKASCTDAVQNGDETDIDCGGTTCPKCALKKKCKIPGDCVSGICANSVCQPPGLKITAGKTVYFEDLAARAQVTAITGTKLTVDPKSLVGKLQKGHEVLLINMQGTAKDTASVGNHELLEVLSVSASDVTLTTAPTRSYGNNKANASLTGQKVFVVQVPSYSTLTVDGVLAAKPWSGTTKALGLVVLRATIKAVVGSKGKIDVSYAGYYSASFTCNGVTGHAGESLAPMLGAGSGKCSHPAPSNKPNFGGGGGGLSNCNVYACKTQMFGAGGGGASYATLGVAGKNNGSQQKGGLPGLSYGQPNLAQLFLGSGGGAGVGGHSGPGSGTTGGRGGGLVWLWGPVIEITGSVLANGQKGGENANCNSSHGSGSGGGGSGGSIYLSGKTVTLPAGQKISALGAKGGCIGGGAAGVGRIRVDYATLNSVAFPKGISSLTNPSAYLAQHK